MAPGKKRGAAELEKGCRKWGQHRGIPPIRRGSKAVRHRVDRLCGRSAGIEDGGIGREDDSLESVLITPRTVYGLERTSWKKKTIGLKARSGEFKVFSKQNQGRSASKCRPKKTEEGKIVRRRKL